jgi:crossover junction endodeoxyribonuclease RuvC
MPNTIKILGIDPGFGRTGWGVCVGNGSKLKGLAYGCIETMAGEDFSYRLQQIFEDLDYIIKKYKPDVVAVEELFFYKNVTTALKVGHARGVILLSARLANIPIMEFTPLQVKQAISGYGKADKKQVQQMVKTFLGLKELPQPDDAADALAVAICATNSYKLNNLYDKK